MRILLVEDEPDLGATIQRILYREKYIVDWVQDGIEAWDYLDINHFLYSVAVFDWMLPGLSGVDLCKRLRLQNNPLPVLMVTAKERIEDKVTGLDAGADDYIVKPFTIAEFLARIRALQRRSVEAQTQHLKVGPLLLDYPASTVFVKGKSILLTSKEFQLLEYFMKHPGQLLSRQQLMNKLWEMQFDSSSNVISAQMRLLRRKLAQYDCEGLIETVYGLGYRLNLPDAWE